MTPNFKTVTSSAKTVTSSSKTVTSSDSGGDFEIVIPTAPDEGETMSAFKRRRRAAKRAKAAQASGALAPVDPVAAELGDVRGAAPTVLRAAKSGGSRLGSGREVYPDGVRLRAALPLTLRGLLDNGTVSEAMATAAARFLMDWQAGYLSGGTVQYGERVSGGGGWSDGGTVAGLDARARIAGAMTAMRPLPAAVVRAVLVDEVSLRDAGAAGPYRDAKAGRGYAVGLLVAGLDELVRFYA